MSRFPAGFHCEPLRRDQSREGFSSGHPMVDAWLTRQALQNQEKHLSVTRVLRDEAGVVAGFFTLATGQVDFGDLPAEIAKKLPRRALPVAVLAWLAVDQRHQGKGLGTRLLAQALSDCHAASQTFAFVAVVVDCIDQAAKAFYRRWDFRELPGRPMRLFLGARTLDAMMRDDHARFVLRDEDSQAIRRPKRPSGRSRQAIR